MRGSRSTVVSIAALALTTALALGCGTVNGVSSQQAGGETRSSVSADEDGSGSDATDAHALPAAKEMDVFSRPRTEEDVLPSRLSYRLSPEGRCTDRQRVDFGCLGDPIADESRLLLSGLGVGKTSLYAWPTTDGGVCWAWDDGAGGCAHDFAGGESRAIFMGIDPDTDGAGAPGTLVGVAPDDVVAAEVKVRGLDRAAVLQSNGLFYELPDGSCTYWALESLTVSYRDGSSQTLPIKWHHGSETLPETCRA
jgi:hypothetical protein